MHNKKYQECSLLCSSTNYIRLNVMQPNPDPRDDARTVGQLILKSRGFFKDEYMFWICVAALFGFALLFNILFAAALTYLNRKSYYLIRILISCTNQNLLSLTWKIKFQLIVNQNQWHRRKKKTIKRRNQTSLE